jgi:uncharacterized protein (TIGR00251 family)
MSQIDWKQTSEGLLLPVHANAGSRKDQINGVHDGRLKISVRQVPEKGKANVEIQKQIAKACGLAASQVELHSGGTNSRKVFLLRDVSLDRVEELEARLLGVNGPSVEQN